MKIHFTLSKAPTPEPQYQRHFSVIARTLFLFEVIDGTQTGTTFRVRVVLGVIAMKSHFTLSKAPTPEPQYQRHFSVIAGTLFVFEVIDGTQTGTTFRVRVVLGVIAMKSHFTLSKAPTPEPQYQRHFSVIAGTLFVFEVIDGTQTGTTFRGELSSE